MFRKQLNSLAMHPKISLFRREKSLKYNYNLKKKAKKKFFEPFQSYISSNRVLRYATSVKSNSRHDGDLQIAINFQEIRHVCKLQQHPYHLFTCKYLLDCCEHRKRRGELSSCKLLNVKNQTYLYLPMYPLNSF